MQDDYIIDMRHITKRFPGIVANDDVTLRVKKGEVFARDDVKVWKCLNCGHLHVGAEAPEVCPACAHPRSYFEAQSVNY